MNRKLRHEPPVETEFLQDKVGGTVRGVRLSKGIVGFDTKDYSFAEGIRELQFPMQLSWEIYDQLDDGRFETTRAGIVLARHGLLNVRGSREGSVRYNKLLREVRMVLQKDQSDMMDIRLDQASIDQKFPMLVAIAVELFAKPLSMVWLAAMAQHALSEGRKYAAGYLMAQVDIKWRGEADYIRGKATLAAAAAGGTSRSHVHKMKRERILRAMEKLVSEGISPRAAGHRVNSELGLGTSGAANAKLWSRSRTT